MLGTLFFRIFTHSVLYPSYMIVVIYLRKLERYVFMLNFFSSYGGECITIDTVTPLKKDVLHLSSTTKHLMRSFSIVSQVIWSFKVLRCFAITRKSFTSSWQNCSKRGVPCALLVTLNIIRKGYKNTFRWLICFRVC